MLDIKFIRENMSLIKDAARKKHVSLDVDELLRVDDDRRRILTEVETMRAEQNAHTGKIVATEEEGERKKMIDAMRVLKEKVKEKEDALRDVMKQWRALMLCVPNIPDISVPEGGSDAENKEIRRWGAVPEFPFEPKDHVALMADLGIIDFERGVKVAGFRGYFLKNDGALLSFALWSYTLTLLARKGYEPLITPSHVRKEIFFGTGYLPQGEEDLYKTQDEMYLVGTAEVPTMGYFMDEIISREELPKKFVAFSPCFRREAGSHGKDTRGVFRVHEFFKLEQVVLCEASHEMSVQYHEQLTKNAEEIMQNLQLPYRVVVNCGGDLGLGQVKKYDIEAWIPSEKTYRETHSSSYFHDFQTRRLHIRYRDEKGGLHYAHSLNNTAVATPRLLVSIIENNQQEDGSIRVPEALQPYLGKKIIKRD